MRILQISSARHFGGGERHFVDLAKGLMQRGHEVFTAVAPASPVLAELPHMRTGNLFPLSTSNPVNIAKAFALRKFVHAHGIEIVHAHMARDYPLAALAAGRGGARLIITRHVLFPMNKLHRLTRGRVTRVIAVSQSVATTVRAQKIFHDDQISVVLNGIDLPRFKRHVSPNFRNRLRVGILGELTENKGQIEFLRAAESVAKQIDNVEFIIAGRENSSGGEYGPRLRNAIAVSEFRDRIQLDASSLDVAEFLPTLDLLVSASRSEAFGLSIVEAMAAGVPVVATASDGAGEIITDNETGRLVPIGREAELATAISRLLRDPEDRERLSRNAREMVTKRFSLERMISETEAVYHEALRG